MLPLRPAGEPSQRKSWRQRALALSVSLTCLTGGLVAAELVFRGNADSMGFDSYQRMLARDYVLRGWAEGYTAHAHSIYRHPPALPEINEDGFNDREWKLERTPGVPRILCLGGSTTEGGNSHGLRGSYPFLLEQILHERLGTQVEVLNAGMSAWNSAEMVTAWFLDLIDYRPDLVIVHEAVNDVEPRKLGGFRRDYSHYRHAFVAENFDPATRWLAARSDLWLWLVNPRTPTIADMTVTENSLPFGFDGQRFIAGSDQPYRRNLLSIGQSLEAYGATLAFMTLPYDPRADDEDNNTMYRIGIREHNQVMRDLADENGWVLCDVGSLRDEQPDVWRPLFLDLVHVQPEGNRIKAERMATALIESGFFDRFPDRTASVTSSN